MDAVGAATSRSSRISGYRSRQAHAWGLRGQALPAHCHPSVTPRPPHPRRSRGRTDVPKRAAAGEWGAAPPTRKKSEGGWAGPSRAACSSDARRAAPLRAQPIHEARPSPLPWLAGEGGRAKGRRARAAAVQGGGPACLDSGFRRNDGEGEYRSDGEGGDSVLSPPQGSRKRRARRLDLGTDSAIGAGDASRVPGVRGLASFGDPSGVSWPDRAGTGWTGSRGIRVPRRSPYTGRAPRLRTARKASSDGREPRRSHSLPLMSSAPPSHDASARHRQTHGPGRRTPMPRGRPVPSGA